MTEETSGLGGGWQYAGAGRGSLSLCLERWRELGAAGGLSQQEAGSGYGVWGEDLGRGLGRVCGLETVVTGAGSLSLYLGRWREHGVAGGGGAWLRVGGSGGCCLGLGQ